MNPSDMARVRAAVQHAIPFTTANYGNLPKPSEVYVPPSHLKALRLDCNLVIGARGVGKSFWASALSSTAVRDLLGKSLRELDTARVSTGFGMQPQPDDYPDGDTFSALIRDGNEPYQVWRAVVSRWLRKRARIDIPASSWTETLNWVKENPESFARLLLAASESFARDGKSGLIVFDALDRTSSNWQEMDKIVRDLLRLVLHLKSYNGLHGKVFLREDQYGRSVTAFPDASKLDATRVELTWAIHDLHGLLWQTLCNAEEAHGEVCRSLYTDVAGKPPKNVDNRYILDDPARRETSLQRTLFEQLAGPWMGRDRRRGVPYVWAVSHLADGNGRTSPRSFLSAIRSAANDSEERYPSHQYPLHYESIKRGVQKASEIRVAEISEDYPWVRTVMGPLEGLTVPCQFSAIKELWIETLPQGAPNLGTPSLPPQHASEGWNGVRTDLERLGVFDTKRDGRIDMPDLYRVGFGLGRKGGVKPVSRRTAHG